MTAGLIVGGLALALLLSYLADRVLEWLRGGPFDPYRDWSDR